MSDGIDLDFCPIRAFFQGAAVESPSRSVGLGDVLFNNTVCLNTLSAEMTADPQSGILAQLIEQVESRTGVNFGEQLTDRVNDLQAFGPTLIAGLKQAGFKIQGADNLPALRS